MRLRKRDLTGFVKALTQIVAFEDLGEAIQVPLSVIEFFTSQHSPGLIVLPDLMMAK